MPDFHLVSKSESASRPGRIKGRFLLLLSVLIVLSVFAFALPVNANSIQFSGLGQVNKSIQIYDINNVADGTYGVVDEINSSGLFYFHPGDSYMFEVAPINNTTFLSGGVPFLDFLTGNGSPLIYAIFFVFFTIAVIGVILYIGK
jgi:hypothetical protein